MTLTPLLSAIAISCGLALTLPYKYHWLEAVKPLVEKNRAWVLIALVLSVVYLAVMILGRTLKGVQRIYRRRQFKKNIGKRMEHLTVPERHVLQRYLIEGTRTIGWRIDEPIIASLVAYGILFRSASMGSMLSFPHDIQDDVWNYLQEHPESIDTPGNRRREPGPNDWMQY